MYAHAMATTWRTFQFTTSQGGRHLAEQLDGIGQIFQFTTSQGGRRSQDWGTSGHWPFNSRPHKEVDRFAKPAHDPVHLSIHDLTRRSTVSSVSSCGFSLFQFTTSQGGRRQDGDDHAGRSNLSIHDLTRRSTW